MHGGFKQSVYSGPAMLQVNRLLVACCRGESRMSPSPALFRFMHRPLFSGARRKLPPRSHRCSSPVPTLFASSTCFELVLWACWHSGSPVLPIRTFCRDGQVPHLCCGYGSHWQHVATEHLKCGQCGCRTEFFISKI